MARIRTYKPDFFTDKRTGRLSCNAKVVFLGLVSCADDYGLLRYEPDELKVKILPYQAGETADLISRPIEVELREHGLIDLFSDGEKSYIHIKTFVRHQRVSRRGAPILKGWSLQMTAEQYKSEHANESFVELAYDGHGEGAESEDFDDADTEGEAAVPAAPVPANRKSTPTASSPLTPGTRDKIVELYHRHFPLGSKVKGWPAKRTKYLRARCSAIMKSLPKEERHEEALLQQWEAVFKRCAKSSFLCGDNDRGWVANLDFMIQESRYNDIIEGKYDGRGGAGKLSSGSQSSVPNKRRPRVVRADLGQKNDE